LTGFPVEVRAGDADLATLAAIDEVTQGSLEAAERYMGLAERASASVATTRQGQAQLLLRIARPLHPRQRGHLAARPEGARRLQDTADVPDPTRPGLGEDLRALALITLGSAEIWAGQIDQAERHLERGVALARRIVRPYLEFIGLAYQAGVSQFRSFTASVALGMQAAPPPEQPGWAAQPT